jgi:aspartyl-tRNA(Asn)/glutamyl-tRNA(Gln) amidotransferase subunit B
VSAAWEATIGLECHAQLRTRTKMFCGCAVVQDAEPNVAVCPICLGYPGTLPALNGAAVGLGVRAAVALSATVHPTSRFARKSYFYPDLPKGYQVTQDEEPLATGGLVHLGARAVRLARLHLEEDAGKMVHDEGGTTVDWNRAGVPLVEIVSEPDLRTPEEAETYLRTLHRVLVESGVCLGDMEKGHFRCDANVSVHRAGTDPGTRVEVKNVNSFRFVAKAIRYEVDRQAALLDAGGAVEQETRTWSGTRTVALRKKEGSAEYRYFPEPDLLPLVVDAAEVARERAALPGVPMDLHLAEVDRARAQVWRERYGLGAYEVGVLLAVPEAAGFFTAAVDAGGAPAAMANLVMADLLRRLNDAGPGALRPDHLVDVQRLLDAGRVNREGARAVLDALAAGSEDDAATIAEARGLGQVGDATTLAAIVADVVVRFPDEATRFRAGNRSLLGFFIGEVMAATGRRADPRLAARLVREALEGGA